MRYVSVAIVTTVLTLSAACGSDSSNDGPGATGREGAKVIDVEMVDIAFKPTELTVAEGEEVTFRFTNNGKVAHDAFIGDRDAQAEHEMQMREGSSGHGGHDTGGDAVTVEPGDTESLTMTFADAGKIEIGCHQPGHYAAGMKIDVTVQ